MRLLLDTHIFLALVYTRRVTAIKLSRHSGRDCRKPDHMDVFISYHPWFLDLGNPCRDDDAFLNLMAATACYAVLYAPQRVETSKK